jgi:hypothetical protein
MNIGTTYGVCAYISARSYSEVDLVELRNVYNSGARGTKEEEEGRPRPRPQVIITKYLAPVIYCMVLQFVARYGHTRAA